MRRGIDEELIAPDDLARSSARGGALTVSSQAFRFVVRMVSQVVLARLLLPADYGLIAMLAPVMALVALLGDLGLAQATMIQRSVTHSQVSGLFWMGLVVSGSMALIVIASTPLLIKAFDEPRLGPIAICLAAMLPVSSFATQHLALIVRRMRFGILSLVDALSPVLGLIAAVTVALSGGGYWSLVAAQATEALASTAILVIASGWWPGRPKFDPQIWGLLRTGGHLTGFNVANYVTTSADNVLLGLIHGKVALGLYDKGYKTVTQPLAQMTAPFSRIAVPMLSRLQDDDVRYRNAFRRLTEMLLLVCTPGLLALIVFARPIILLVFGPNWEQIIPVVGWLCFGALSSGLYGSLSWLFVSQNRTGEQLRFALITSALALAGFAIGLPWGARGVAAGAGLVFLLACVPLSCWAAGRTGPVGHRDLVGIFARFLFGSVATYAVLEAAYRWLGPDPSLVTAAAAAIIAYAVFPAVLLLLPSGRRTLSDAWATRQLLRRG